MASSARAKAKCLYNSFGRGREEHKGSEEMRNKQKYNRNSKVDLPKKYRKNKKQSHARGVVPVNTKYRKRAQLHMYFCMLAILLFLSHVFEANE